MASDRALATRVVDDSLTTARQVGHLLELRMAVETHAAALAVRRADAADLEGSAPRCPTTRPSAPPKTGVFTVLWPPHHTIRWYKRQSKTWWDASTIGGLRVPGARRATTPSRDPGPAPHDTRGDRRGGRTGSPAVSGPAPQLRRTYSRPTAGSEREVRMLVCDLDGTLLAGPRFVTERTREAIASARDDGFTVVLASADPHVP